MNLESLFQIVKNACRKPLAVPLIFFLAFALRFLALIFSGQLHTSEYWEYGQIVQNLMDGNGYSFPFIDRDLNFTSQNYPSALMPPGYVFFLYPFFWITSEFIRNLLLFSVQIGISLLAIRLFYVRIKEKTSNDVAFIALVLLAILPDLVYAPVTVGPTVWFHFLIGVFLWLYSMKGDWKTWIFQGVTAGILVLMRSESLLIFAFLTLAAVRKGNWKWAISLVFWIGVIASPWLNRTVQTFGTPILSANVGVNLYRGNNPTEIGDWPPVWDEAYERLRENPQTFEQEYDARASSLAKTYIENQPVEWISNFPVKIFRFWVIDWPDQRTHSPAFWLPWFFCLIVGFLGLLRPEARRFRTELLIVLTYTLIILIFFPQLRYQTMVKVCFIPFCAIGISWLIAFFRNTVSASK